MTFLQVEKMVQKSHSRERKINWASFNHASFKIPDYLSPSDEFPIRENHFFNFLTHFTMGRFLVLSLL